MEDKSLMTIEPARNGYVVRTGRHDLHVLSQRPHVFESLGSALKFIGENIDVPDDEASE